MPRSAFLSRAISPATPLDAARLVHGIAILVSVVFVFWMCAKGWREKRAVAVQAEQQVEDLRVRDAARAEALRTVMVAKDAEELESLLEGMGQDSRQYLLNGGGMREAFRGWYARDLGFALGMVEGLPFPDRLHAFRWGEDFHLEDPGLVLAAARRNLDLSGENSVSFRIFRELGKTDAAKGVVLLPEVTQEIVRSTVLEVFYSNWAAREPAPAMESASTLENARDRATAYAAIVKVKGPL